MTVAKPPFKTIDLVLGLFKAYQAYRLRTTITKLLKILYKKLIA